MTGEHNSTEDMIARLLAEHLPLSKADVAALLETPPHPEMGDYGLPCFSLARSLRKAPNAIAEELADRIELPEGVREVRAIGPYVNFFADRPLLTKKVLTQILRLGGAYGDDDLGRGKRVLVEYSSPNVAKHLSVFHLRGTVIGNSLCKIYRKLGFDVIGLNYLGDWGTSFGKQIAAFERYDTPPAEQLNVSELQELYVRFSKDSAADPELEQAARDAFLRLEQGEPKAVALWTAFKTVSLAEFGRVYDLLGITFDRYSGESIYRDRIPDTVGRIKRSGVAVESEGALIIPLDDQDMPPCLIQKSDGASLYHTRDICAAEHRWEQFHFDKALYVVGGEQQLHFRQLKAGLKKMGYDWSDRIEHIHCGVMSFLDTGTGQVLKGSTRDGVTVLLHDVLEETVRKARQKIEDNADRFEEGADLDDLAVKVGIGAAIFCDLAVRRARDVVFDMDKILDFEGDTGPYVQYAHARLCSILRKADQEVTGDVDFSLLALPEEWVLVRHLERYPHVIRRAAEENEPSLVATYLLELCADFSAYYSAGNRDPELRVLCSDEGTRAARLLLVDATRHVIWGGLELLGVQAPERM